MALAESVPATPAIRCTRTAWRRRCGRSAALLARVDWRVRWRARLAPPSVAARWQAALGVWRPRHATGWRSRVGSRGGLRALARRLLEGDEGERPPWLRPRSLRSISGGPPAAAANALKRSMSDMRRRVGRLAVPPTARSVATPWGRRDRIANAAAPSMTTNPERRSGAECQTTSAIPAMMIEHGEDSRAARNTRGSVARTARQFGILLRPLDLLEQPAHAPSGTVLSRSTTAAAVGIPTSLRGLRRHGKADAG